MVLILSKTLCISILLTLRAQCCTTKNSNVNDDLNVKRHESVYGNDVNHWEFENGETLEYPKGDKHKIHQISSIWSRHYDCLSRVATTVKKLGYLPGIQVAAFVGAVARLPCDLCIAPDERTDVKWIYAQSPYSKLEPILLKHHMSVEPNMNLTIYGVKEDDCGVYKCTIGSSVSGPVYVEVTDPKEGYNVVKSPSTRGPYPLVPFIIKLRNTSLKVFTLWSPWSECSACAQVGRRRKHGMCYVNLEQNTMEMGDQVLHASRLSEQRVKLTLNRNTLKLFEAFPDGIPCRSSHLPLQLRQLHSISQRRNEIMIGLCKVDCDTPSEFDVRSIHGAVLERANNSAGIYSLWQQKPRPMSCPLTHTLFVARGDQLNITCPGKSLRDIPLTWRVGTKELSPRTVDRRSLGRVHLNAQDHIVFSFVTYSDDNLYSCWQRDILVGTVKLVVWEGGQLRWNQHILLVVMLQVAGVVLRLADWALRNKRRRLGVF